MSTAQTYSKHFIPLESNPEVFTELAHKLGLSASLEFEDVFSLDEELLALVPRPVLGLILVFPTTEEYEKKVEDEDALLESFQSSEQSEDVVFFKQTINNACGLYAILHTVCNGEARDRLSKTLTSRQDHSNPTRKRLGHCQSAQHKLQRRRAG